MGKKRKSGGRSKGKKGSLGKVQCSSCGRLVPRDKAKRKTSFKQLVDFTIPSKLIVFIDIPAFYSNSDKNIRHHNFEIKVYVQSVLLIQALPSESFS